MMITTPTHADELSHYFMIMGRLATAKANNDAEDISELIDDLEMMAHHAGTAMVRRHAANEAEQASALLHDLQSKRMGYAGPLIVLTRAADPANLN